MKKRISVIAAVLALFAILTVFAGCQKKETEETPLEINVGLAQDIDDSLDPHRTTAAATREVLFNVFEGLVKPDTDGNMVPAVASAYTVSESGDVFTFTLRDGVKFHNGSPVTADDVVYSILRCKGTDGGEALISAFSIVESVEAVDAKTVAITTSVPDIEFLSYLTAAIIPKDYNDQAVKPVGTGPFKYVSRAPQENIILERFDDYWGTKAALNRVVFKIVDNAETLMMSLRSGAIDFCAHLTTSQMQELEGGDFNFEIGTMHLVQAVYLNNTSAPFDDVRVRQALSYAIDREQIIQILSDGLATPVGSSMYPAFKKYFMPELADYYKPDAEKAKQLLADAGYPNGFDMEIVVPSNHQPHIDTATVVVDQMRAAGVNATIKLVEWGTWVSDVYSASEFQSTIVGVDASAMTARAMLERFYSGSGKNFIKFSDAEYDETYLAAIASTDDAEQTRLYKRLQEILTEKAANLYIQDLCDIVAVNKKLGGYTPYPIFVLDLSKLYFVS